MTEYSCLPYCQYTYWFGDNAVTVLLPKNGWVYIVGKHLIKYYSLVAPLLAPFLFPALVSFAAGWFLLAFAYYKAQIYPRYFSPLRNIPGPPLSAKHWLIGQLPHLAGGEAGEPGHLHAEWLRKYGDERQVLRTVGPFGWERLYFFSPTALRTIMTDYSFIKPSVYRRLLTMVTGPGLLTVEDDAHRKMRRALNPAFATKYLAMQYEEYVPLLQNLVDFIDNEIGKEGYETVIDIHEYVERTLLDVISLTAFGHPIDCLRNPDEPLAKAYHEVAGSQGGARWNLLLILLYLPWGLGLKLVDYLVQNSTTCTPRLLRFAERYDLDQLATIAKMCESMATIQAIATRLLAQKTREARLLGDRGLATPGDSDASNPDKIDILSLIIKAAYREDSNYRMTPREATAHVMTFLGAGHETTASGASWAIWLLATHPQVQQKLREECQELVAHGRPSFSQMRSSEYLNAVVQETLRIKPAIPGTARETSKDSWIDGIWVPKGTVLSISSYAINTNPRYWGATGDLEEFKPERWIGSGSNGPAKSEDFDQTYSFFSFIAGNHHCIGRNMAILEMKAVLVSLVTRFSWTVAYEGQQVCADAAISQRPAGGVPIKMKRSEAPDA